jgi:hypothetical protein
VSALSWRRLKLMSSPSGWFGLPLSCTRVSQISINISFFDLQILYFVLYLQSPHHGKSISDLKRLAAEPAVPASFNSRGPAVSALRLPLAAISGFDILFPQMIERCWAADPKQRPSFQQIYQAIDDLNIV